MRFTYENGIIKTPENQFGYDVSGGVGCVLFAKMKQHREKTAQIEARTGNYDTYEYLLQKCIRTAIVLKQKIGIKRGDHIAVCSDNHLNACVPLISAYFIGAIPFSLGHSQTVEEHTHLLKQIHPKVIFVMNDSRNKIEQALTKAGIPTPQIVTFETNFRSKFLSKQNDEETFTPTYISDIKETAAVYFSSGSTGLPKGICVSHYAILCFYYPGKSEGEQIHSVYFNPSSWYWISSGITLFRYTAIGGCRLLVSDYKAEELWEWIDKYKITEVFLLFFHCIELTSKPKPKNLDCSSLKAISTGGSRVPKEYVEKMRTLLPEAKFFQSYGMTELLSVTGFWKENIELAEKKVESMGQPLPGNWYKVVDPDTEEILGPNQPGELRLKSKRIMNGYYNKDCSDVFDKEGWFKTGDLVYYDEDFCFFFVCRLKEGLSYRSEWVYPKQIEDVLMQHPAVKLAVVTGTPHPTDEEHPTAVIILKEGWENTKPKELEMFVNERVEDRNKLRGGVFFAKKLPLTTTGKINRFRVKQMVINNSY